MSAPSGTASRFTAPNQSTEQRLATNVVGLVELSDFRKRRAEALEQAEREAREAAAATGSTAAAVEPSADVTPDSNGDSNGDGNGEPKKKKKKSKKKVNKLSFLDDDDDDDDDTEEAEIKVPATTTKIAAGDIPPIKSFTQQALRRQAAEREALRKEYLQRQAAVKAAEVAIPFVFYEGANVPGGVVRVKKGDYVWLMLDRSRKVGARLGEAEETKKTKSEVGSASVSGPGSEAGPGSRNPPRPSKARMHWARINVDDLMLVRGNLIIPHHYDFYYFVINQTVGPGGVRIFDYSNEPPAATATATATADTPLEGADDDPTLTKVVDRRWYERNKHIYPASLWQDFDPEADYTQQVRRDQGGNAFFFAPSER